MRFQVPQFIDFEDKVFGPFTFKQFIYLAGGAGMCFVLLRTLPQFLAILLSIPVVALSVALAFYRMNNRPFIQLVEAFFKYIAGTRLYVWKRKDKQEKTVQSRLGERYLHLEVPKLGESRLKDLTWSIDARKDDKETGDSA